MSSVEGLFSFRCRSRADDSSDVVLELRVDDQYQAAVDRADRDEAIFEIRMIAVEDFHVVVVSVEELLCLLERDLMLKFDCVVPFISPTSGKGNY